MYWHLPYAIFTYVAEKQRGKKSSYNKVCSVVYCSEFVRDKPYYITKRFHPVEEIPDQPFELISYKEESPNQVEHTTRKTIDFLRNIDMHVEQVSQVLDLNHNQTNNFYLVDYIYIQTYDKNDNETDSILTIKNIIKKVKNTDTKKYEYKIYSYKGINGVYEKTPEKILISKEDAALCYKNHLLKIFKKHIVEDRGKFETVEDMVENYYDLFWNSYD